MNMNQIVRMATRIIMAKMLHHGINKGIDVAANMKRKPKSRPEGAWDQAQMDHDDAPQVTQDAPRRQASSDTKRRAKQTMRLARRMTRM